MSVSVLFLLGCLGLVMTAQAQDCSPPTRGSNMDLTDEFINSQSFADGSTVTFKCNVGYYAVGGSSKTTCTAGSWSAVQLVCEKKNCGSVGKLDNGDIDYREGNEFGAKAYFICNIGYYLVGSKETRCEDGGWSARIPTCEGVTCQPPETIENGRYTQVKDIYGYHESVQYSCDNNLNLIGLKTLTCTENGHFEPEPPQCVYVQCKDPSVPNGEFVEGSRPPHGLGASLKYKCKDDYKMIGSATITCNITSQWNPQVPECVKSQTTQKTTTTTTTTSPSGPKTQPAPGPTDPKGSGNGPIIGWTIFGTIFFIIILFGVLYYCCGMPLPCLVICGIASKRRRRVGATVKKI